MGKGSRKPGRWAADRKRHHKAREKRRAEGKLGPGGTTFEGIRFSQGRSRNPYERFHQPRW